MYPFIRMFWQLFRHRNDDRLGATDVHESTHYCMPWDIDLWAELNNGRTLTIFDLGRIPMARRMGLVEVLRDKKWGMAIAGASVRYRRRVKMFDRITMRSRVVGWDSRFLYIEQGMWKSNGECANHALLRGAITNANGIVPPADLAAALGHKDDSPVLPGWVQGWIDADAERDWPPMQS